MLQRSEALRDSLGKESGEVSKNCNASHFARIVMRQHISGKENNRCEIIPEGRNNLLGTALSHFHYYFDMMGFSASPPPQEIL